MEYRFTNKQEKKASVELINNLSDFFIKSTIFIKLLVVQVVGTFFLYALVACSRGDNTIVTMDLSLK